MSTGQHAERNRPPNELAFFVDGDTQGIRIDRFLCRQLRNYSTFRMQRMIRAGAVAADGQSAPLTRRVRRGERVVIRLVEPPDKLFEPERLPVEILYEDDSLIAVNKPPGQIVHPVGAWQSGTLCHALQWHFDAQSALRGLLRPGIVHRLDRMTSGVMVVSKVFSAHRRLSLQFQRRQVEKRYLAVVQGVLRPHAGTIDLPIGHLPGREGILMTTRRDARHPRPARTEYEVLECGEGITLVGAKPLTGRIHQLRVHFAALGHPILGDEFYGPFGEIHPGDFEAQTARRAVGDEAASAGRHLLHAWELVFHHPATGSAMTIRAPLPADFGPFWSGGRKRRRWTRYGDFAEALFVETQ